MSSNAPFTGLRVVDFTHILAGPLCTQLLSDAGATVVKVEPPGGEYARLRGFIRKGREGVGLSSYHSAVNRGKQSIVLDLKHSRGLEVALRLISAADVVVENLAPGALVRLGIDFDDLRQADPRLISASISLFGGGAAKSPLTTRGGLAIVAEGESGVTSVTRDRDGIPISVGFPLGDTATALACYAAIVTALYERERTGRGRHLDISMVKTLLTLNSPHLTGAQIDGWTTDVGTVGYGIFPTIDGFVSIGVNTDSLFGRLASAMADHAFASDSRFTSYGGRVKFYREGTSIVCNWTSTRSTAEVISALVSTGVPCGKVSSPPEVLADGQFRELGFFQTVADGVGGTIDTPSNPFGFDRPDSSLPGLAQHARSILRDLGVDDHEYEDLELSGAFGSVREAAPST